jgi:5-methyltetrahydropteroyltriglutamate--homocysteine methyltransferase
MPDLPLLPTMGVGSYAPPGWFIAARRMVRDGGFGEGDIEELFDDAIRIVVADQIAAGVDIVSDGELRRQRFVYEMYDRIGGLTRVPPRRRLGIPGYDMAPGFVANERPAAEDGLGVVADFEALKRLEPTRPLKVALPGPLTFAASIDAAGVGTSIVLDSLVDMVRDELAALIAAGADYVQLDEPSLPHPPYDLAPEDGAKIINRVLDGLSARRAVHVCFGNNAGRPRADRRFGRLMDAMSALDCEQLVLEFANREMADVDCLGPLSKRFDIAAGVVDVKNWRLETADDVARRIRQCLEQTPAEKLSITADCGFSALPRYLARDKMIAMVEGAALVRASL